MIMNHLFLRSPFRSFASDVSKALRLIKPYSTFYFQRGKDPIPFYECPLIGGGGGNRKRGVLLEMSG
jgi:hypothetical protein